MQLLPGDLLRVIADNLNANDRQLLRFCCRALNRSIRPARLSHASCVMHPQVVQYSSSVDLCMKWSFIRNNVPKNTVIPDSVYQSDFLDYLIQHRAPLVLIQKVCDGYFPVLPTPQNILTAFRHGNVEVVRFLVSEFENVITVHSIETAVCYGHLNIVERWLTSVYPSNNLTPDYKTNIVLVALRQKHWHVARYLIDNDTWSIMSWVKFLMAVSIDLVATKWIYRRMQNYLASNTADMGHLHPFDVARLHCPVSKGWQWLMKQSPAFVISPPYFNENLWRQRTA